MDTIRTLNFGIEIEVVGLSRPKIAKAIHAVVGGTMNNMSCAVTDDTGRTWNVVHDGSLAGGGGESGEIVSPILRYEDLERLQEIVRAVREAGAQANETCGIHVHIGAERFDAKALANLIKTMNKQELIIEKSLKIRDARLQRYCRRVDPAVLARIEGRRPTTLAAMNAAWYGYEVRQPRRMDESRYHGLNLNSFFLRKTIEFRLFNGSLHAGEVKTYVQFALALAAKALDAKGSRSRKRAYSEKSARYDMRVFLLGLGMIGPEFKTARHHLLKHLPGSAAWKNGRPATAATSAVASAAVPTTA